MGLFWNRTAVAIFDSKKLLVLTYGIVVTVGIDILMYMQNFELIS